MAEQEPDRPKFRQELEDLLYKYNLDTRTNIPDFILADFLVDNLDAYVRLRDRTESWFEGTEDPLPNTD
jgi:hypothetical protein